MKNPAKQIQKTLYDQLPFLLSSYKQLSNLLKSDLFCKQISFILAIFGGERIILKIKFMLQEYTFVEIRF